VLCKHEVVGSIPSGSTRWLIAAAALKGSSSIKEFATELASQPSVRVVSDIVKRKHIRLSCRQTAAVNSLTAVLCRTQQHQQRVQLDRSTPGYV
jgi:hypothetical protein